MGKYCKYSTIDHNTILLHTVVLVVYIYSVFKFSCHSSQRLDFSQPLCPPSDCTHVHMTKYHNVPILHLAKYMITATDKKMESYL